MTRKFFPQYKSIKSTWIRYVSIILVAIIFLELIIILSYQNNQNQSILLDLENEAYLDFSKSHEIWAHRIEKLGAKKAYEVFKEVYKTQTPNTQHKFAHVFGELLYEKEGISGVSVCDNSFAFGCYHSFLGNAIHKEGLKVVDKLNEKCIENLKSQGLGCQHGLGHGIFTSLGYEYNDLINALQICENLPANDTIGGCVGGAFMEYNFRTMLGDDAIIRPVDDNLYFPCSSLSQNFRPACYYWQSQWWGGVLKGETKEKYKSISILCEGLSDSSERKQCFLGAGNVAGSFIDWDVDKAKELCAQFSSEGEILCRAGAAGSFAAEPSVRKEAKKLCEDFDSERQRTCILHSNVL